MSKLGMALAAAGLFGTAGIALCCDLDDKDASAPSAPMVSKPAPAVAAGKPSTIKTAAKAKAVAPAASVAKPDVVAKRELGACDAAPCN
jgi:hypothetical protein